MRTKRSLSVVAGALLAAASLTACGSGGSTSRTDPAAAEASMSPAEKTLYTAALKEGSVTWYAEADDHGSAAAFQKKYPGIKVNYLRLPSGQLSTRFSQERDSGTVPADLLLTGDQLFLKDARSKGWLTPSLPQLPALASWPKQFVDGDVVKIAISPTGIAYNPSLVSPADVPKTWADIINPKFKTYALPDPSVVEQFLATASLWQKEYGTGFLKKVGALKPTVQASTQTINQSIASGGTAISLMDAEATVSLLQEQGAPIKFLQLSPTTGNEFYMGVTAGARHPNAAALLLDYLMTKEGQQAFAVGLVSPLGNLPGTQPMPKDYQPFDAVAVNKQKSQILSALGLPDNG
jgi:ABC-type Fe3+ transport system substrate-binding protein